jgi:hypothetical protein
MIEVFKEFDFSVVKDDEFKEDSVREILIIPIFDQLGYKPYGEYSIERTKALTHPYVLIGTKKQKINIFPDYILKVKGKRVCVLDAKSPKENIISGKNVEQAYSYAIHPKVRTKLYALCNGVELTIFHINQIKPILHAKLESINDIWSEVEEILAPYKIEGFTPFPESLYPDYGVLLHKLSYTESVKQFEYGVPVDHITRLDDNTYSINLNRMVSEQEYAATFDFDDQRFAEFLLTLPRERAIQIFNALRKQPYQVDIQPPHSIDIVSRLGKPTQTKFEEIVPLIVEEFVAS